MDGRVKKYTNKIIFKFVRDNRIYYTSLRLLFLIIIATPINVWETFRLFRSCHDDSGWSVLIQSYYY